MGALEWQEKMGGAWRAFFGPPSALYGAAVRRRDSAYLKGTLETVRYPVPVFCVGNLTTGGAGKTPGVSWLINDLLSKGRRPAILTRGYGRRDESSLLIVSDGKNILAKALEAGDEPLLLARRFATVPVVAHSDRAAAARQAIERFSADCLVMDDGFQHHRLHRDMNLVCVDATDPGALGLSSSGEKMAGSFLLPSGRMREPLSGLERAHIIFLTKANFCGTDQLQDFKNALAGHAPGVPLVPVDYRLSFWDSQARMDFPETKLKGISVLALSGLARPQSFEEALGRLGARVVPCRFPDHHFFTDQELASVTRRASQDGALIVVTEKDYQRLPGSFPGVVARLDWVPDEADQAWRQKINSAIS
jgi:tetraacyldisaccharide 4'-kinase